MNYIYLDVRERIYLLKSKEGAPNVLKYGYEKFIKDFQYMWEKIFSRSNNKYYF